MHSLIMRLHCRFIFYYIRPCKCYYIRHMILFGSQSTTTLNFLANQSPNVECDTNHSTCLVITFQILWHCWQYYYNIVISWQCCGSYCEQSWWRVVIYWRWPLLSLFFFKAIVKIMSLIGLWMLVSQKRHCK